MACISTTAKAPLDDVLLHFPEVRLGTIVGRAGIAGKHGGGIIWTFRLPDASYCRVQIGFITNPIKALLKPEIADELEEVWQDMGDDALGKEHAGFKWASDEFMDIADGAIFMNIDINRFH
jgi:hypothetical protein